MGKFVGQSIKRVEDPRFIQGKGRYVANLKLPNLAYCAIKRSPYAHAKISGIDTSEAEALDGVLAVYVGQHLIDAGLGALPCGWLVPGTKVPVRHAVMADEVHHVGDAVAVVVAESRYIAQDALDLIDVDYEPLDVVVDAREAMQDGAPQLHPDIENNVSYTWALGEKEISEAAMNNPDNTIVEMDLLNQRLIPNAMEPRACVADYNTATEDLTVWTTSQNPSPIRLLLSAFTLFVPEHKLRVISPDVGGGFGSKIFHYPEEIIVPWASMQLGRPVKWVATRSESFVTDSQGRDHVTTAKLAVNPDHKIEGIHVSTWSNQGAYLSTFAPLIPTAFYICLLSGLYKIPGVYGEMWGTLTNTVPVDAYRGAGRPEASYVIERLIDVASHRLGVDPIEFRRQNFIQPDEFPYQTPVALTYDSGDYNALFDKVVEVAEYDLLRQNQQTARDEGRLVGVGVAGCIEASGPAPSKVAGSLGSAVGFWESGKVRVHPTGKISVFTGSHSHGQGHETAFAQIVAEELGIPMEDIDIVHGDTDRVPFGMGTYGSRSASVGGSALVMSARKVRDKMIKVAAHQLEAAEEDIVYDVENGGGAYVRGAPDKKLSFFELSLGSYTAHNLPDDIEPGLEETTFYDPANFTFPNSAHIAQVEIDKSTGEVTIQKYVAIDDVGNIINPMIVEGQVVGGIAQGVGQALLEHGTYDENGQLTSGSFLDYAMPRADNFVMMNVDRTITPSPHNPLGVKGCGEMGTITSTVTVANAVMDALAPLGIEHIDMPLTAQKIYQAIQSAEA